MGERPSGYVTFMPGGRVFFMLTGEGRKPGKTDRERAELLDTLVAYTGTYNVGGETWTTSVDVAWNPEWVGTKQVRSFKLEGDRLDVLTPWRIMPNWSDKGMQHHQLRTLRVTSASRCHVLHLFKSFRGYQNEDEIERTFERFGAERIGIERIGAERIGADHPTVAVIVLADGSLVSRRDLIATSAAHHRVPTIYPFSVFVSAGGLMSFGNSLTGQSRQAAGYIDRIQRGAHPGDLPVQKPRKYEFVINLIAASALGLSIPPSLLLSADEVIA